MTFKELRALLLTGLIALGDIVPKYDIVSLPGAGTTNIHSLKPKEGETWILQSSAMNHTDVAARTMVIYLPDPAGTNVELYRGSVTQATQTTNLYDIVPSPLPWILTSSKYLEIHFIGMGANKASRVFSSYYKFDRNLDLI